MEHLYHLSHFFVFFCSVYFGSSILIFVEKDLIHQIYHPINDKIKEIDGVRGSILDRKKTLEGKPFPKIRNKEIFFLRIGFPLFTNQDDFFDRRLKKKKLVLDNLFSKKEQSLILKMFFPSFFMTGTFCLILVLLSGFQNTNQNPFCYKAIDCFLINLCYFTFIGQFISLIVIPKLVSRVNYFYLIFWFLAISLFTLSIITIISAKFFVFHCEYMLNGANIAWVESLAIVIALFPLLFLLLISVWTKTFKYLIMSAVISELIVEYFSEC